MFRYNDVTVSVLNTFYKLRFYSSFGKRDSGYFKKKLEKLN